MADGFSMSKSLLNLSLDHILVSMKTIGNFHGTSFALKHTNRTAFDALKDDLIEANFKIRPSFAVLLQAGAKRALNYFRQTADTTNVTEAFLNDFEELFCGGHALDFLRSKTEVKEPLATICHGDFLRNNIAFRYDENGVAVDTMLFDLQTIRYASPMMDLCAFMTISTGHEVRQRNFDLIFRTYHDALLDQFVKETDLNATDVPDYLR